MKTKVYTTLWRVYIQ